jgi:phosphatidate cytidylyltransferase
MLHTRLWVGTLLALAAVGVLFADALCAPNYPFLFLCVAAVGVAAAYELIALLPEDTRPRTAVTVCGVLILLAANWWSVIAGAWPKAIPPASSAWDPVLVAFVGIILASLLLEMANYRSPGSGTARVANSIFVTAYLGLLASCFVRIRFDTDESVSGLALAAAIAVPKCGDIGAYLIGRVFGRHKFAPLLSPKKTWEGFAGGMLFAVATAAVVSSLGPVFRHGIGHAIVFGLAVGAAGVYGDLAESMIKRDAQSKDASRAVPGFGGVLDVIDSVLFAAPVAYLLLRI